ncbi:MAG: hypothetical protein R2733_24475 [Acidimicrobiales bacterium]
MLIARCHPSPLAPGLATVPISWIVGSFTSAIVGVVVLVGLLVMLAVRWSRLTAEFVPGSLLVRGWSTTTCYPAAEWVLVARYRNRTTDILSFVLRSTRSTTVIEIPALRNVWLISVGSRRSTDQRIVAAAKEAGFGLETEGALRRSPWRY